MLQMDAKEVFIKDIPAFFRKFKGTTKDGQYDTYCQEFAYSLIYGNLNSSHLDEILDLVGLSRLPDRLLLLQTDYNDVFQFYPEFSQFPRRYNLIQVLQRCLKRSGLEGLAVSYPARGVIGVFLCLGQDSSSEERAVTEEIKKLALEMIKRVNDEAGEHISAGVSKYCSSLSRFPQAYAECKEALLHSFRFGRNSLCFYKDISEPKQVFERERLQNFCGELAAAILSGEQEKVDAQIDGVMDYMLSVAMTPINIRLIFVSFVDVLRGRFANTQIETEVLEKIYLNAAKGIVNSIFSDDIKKTLEGFCSTLMKELGSETQNGEEQLLHKIDEAIENYYPNSEFNMDVMANIFHYSPYHFGRLFKNLRGVSFRHFLAEYRIERAKEALTRGEKANDVAFQTGFSSVSYFCTVFKNITGLSPKQYQENFK